MVLLATWTVVYHVSLVLRLGVAWAAVLQEFALAGALCLWWGRRPRAPESSTSHLPRTARTLRPTSPVQRLLAVVAVACGLAAAMLVALDTFWPLIAGLWIATAADGTVLALLVLSESSRGQPPAAEPDRPAADRPTGAVVALVWAAGLAALSMVLAHPDPDDLFYVNMSQWVVDQGTFPVRDTIFSDEVFAMANWPPVASYDALVGTLSRLTGVHAASIAYLVVPPIGTFLSVLALWRLLRVWGDVAIGVALSTSLTFLLLDGGSAYAAFGNLFLTRMWQGKVLLLCLMVPILLVLALRFVREPSWRHTGWLFAGGVAAVGLSTSAIFLVPLLAYAGMAPLAVRRPGAALKGFLALAAYPLGAGLVTVLVGGHTADVFAARKLYRFDPAWFGHAIFGGGPLAVIAVLAVLVGALFVADPEARLITGLLALIWGVVLIPGVTHLSYDVLGLGPTLWRVSWVTTVAALVGVLGARLAMVERHRVVRVGGPLALVVAMVVFGEPVWSEDSGTTWQAPAHWKRSDESVDTAQLAISAARPGDLILVRNPVAVTITVLTTKVKVVAPRPYYLDYLRNDPNFRYTDRLLLMEFVALTRTAHSARVARALTTLDVDEVCLPVEAVTATRFLLSQGYGAVGSSSSDRCLTR